MGEDIIITHYNKIKDEQNIILYRTWNNTKLKGEWNRISIELVI